MHGVSDHVAVTFIVAASIWRSWFVSSMLTKIFPLPSVAENSGLPGSGIVAITLLDEVSITVASLLPPLKAKTRLFVGSNKIASGFFPAGNSGNDFEGGAVKRTDGTGASVADVAHLSFVIQSYAMRMLEAADLCNQLSGLCVYDHDAVRASNIQKMGWVVDFEVVPAAIATEFPGVAYLERSLRGCYRRDGK